MNDAVVKVLRRSDELGEALAIHLGPFEHEGTPRAALTVLMCAIADEHAQNLRNLIDTSLPPLD